VPHQASNDLSKFLEAKFRNHEFRGSFQTNALNRGSTPVDNENLFYNL